jgi:chromosome transmission fidelity protein 1
VVSVNEFLFKAEIDNMNLFKLARYFEVSEISKRVHGFTVKKEEKTATVSPARPRAGARGSSSSSDNGGGAAAVGGGGGGGGGGPAEEYVSKHVSALKTTESFFLSLTNADRDGKLVVQPDKDIKGVTIKFLLLNPVSFC